MSKTLEFYFDVGSPTSYLAWTQLPAIARETGARLDFRPVLLGGIFQATGNASPVNIPAKGKWMLSDLERVARRYGVPLRFNPHFPVNTLLMMRAITGVLAEKADRFEAFTDALFRGMWVEGQNLGLPAEVGKRVAAAGFEAEEILALAQAQATKDRLKAATEAAIQRGLFGVPVVIVGEEFHFGQDRLDFVREAARA